MGTREDMLTRIRAARADVPGAEAVGSAPIPRSYLHSRPSPEGDLARFCERVADYRAGVERVAPDQVAVAVGRALTGFGARRVAFAEELPANWRVDGVEVVRDTVDAPLDVAALQRVDAVVTGAAVGIAQTGTVVLDGRPTCGRRALTLVPDAHVCVIEATDIVDDVPAALARLIPSRPLTWISGPSATSDIELKRVEGVHGPRRLHIVVVETGRGRTG
ncbi:MAG TPA: lactate utilization protein C [Kineosporiaceae bacterium]|nr:lactate utilization protein C [Kineosporiaceae bacterium]